MWKKRGKDCTSQGSLDGVTHRITDLNSQELLDELGRLYGTDVGLLQVCDSHVDCSLRKAYKSESMTTSQHLVDFGNLFSMLDDLNIRGGAQSCYNLKCQALCKPRGGLHFSELRWRRNG